jgi:hypothetical protein
MLRTSLRGGVAGAVATAVMTFEQPLDKRLFDSKYDDVEILGKLVTRGDGWRPIGFVLHLQNGAILGAAYVRIKPSLPCSVRHRPRAARGRAEPPQRIAQAVGPPDSS